LKPTSYSVADDEKLLMWPPSPSSLSLARMTMASAFQRIRERMRRSMNRSPGMGFCSAGLMVLRNGVVMAGGSRTPASTACSATRSSR
jgi:hypothetical protein